MVEEGICTVSHPISWNIKVLSLKVSYAYDTGDSIKDSTSHARVRAPSFQIKLRVRYNISMGQHYAVYSISTYAIKR